MLIYIFIVAIIFVAILLTIFITYYNKFQIAIIKISEAEENIKILLNKKFEYIIRINSFVEDKKPESKIPGLEKFNTKNFNTFELNTELNKYNKKIVEITDYSKNLVFDDKEEETIRELEEINIELLGSEKYYNDNVVIYNKLIKCFPSNIVGKICKYKSKDFYSNEKEEIFEILKK